MTTMMDYAMVRLTLRQLSERFNPSAVPVAPSSWQRVQTRLRGLL